MSDFRIIIFLIGACVGSFPRARAAELALNASGALGHPACRAEVAGVLLVRVVASRVRVRTKDSLGQDPRKSQGYNPDNKR